MLHQFHLPGDIAEGNEALLRRDQRHADDPAEAFVAERRRLLDEVGHRYLKRRLQSSEQRLVETHRVIENLGDFRTSLNVRRIRVTVRGQFAIVNCQLTSSSAPRGMSV